MHVVSLNSSNSFKRFVLKVSSDVFQRPGSKHVRRGVTCTLTMYSSSSTQSLEHVFVDSTNVGKFHSAMCHGWACQKCVHVLWGKRSGPAQQKQHSPCMLETQQMPCRGCALLSHSSRCSPGQSGTFGPKFTASTLGCPEVVNQAWHAQG